MDLQTSDQLHQIKEALRAAKEHYAGDYLVIASLLALVKRESLWKGSYPTFVMFLQDEGISRTWGYRAVACWERWGEKAKGIIPDRLNRMLKLTFPDVETEETYLEAARTYNPGAFQDQLRQLQGLPTSDSECSHEPETRCKVCRKLLG